MQWNVTKKIDKIEALFFKSNPGSLNWKRYERENSHYFFGFMDPIQFYKIFHSKYFPPIRFIDVHVISDFQPKCSFDMGIGVP